MQRWIWILIALVISTGVYFTIRYGLRPKPIPVMNATEFARLDEIGAVLYKRLRQDIRVERVVLLGSDPRLREGNEVWTGFIRAAQADGVVISTVYQHQGLSLPIGSAEEFPVADEEFAKRVRDRLHSGQLLLIHDQTIEISHLRPDSFSAILDRVLRQPVLSLSTVLVKAEEMDQLKSECVGPTDNPAPRLACATSRVAKLMSRKKLAPEKMWSIIERHGLREYLVFVREPKP